MSYVTPRHFLLTDQRTSDKILSGGNSMPFASKKQRRFMHAAHPDIADRWEKEAKKEGKPAVRKKKKKSFKKRK